MSDIVKEVETEAMRVLKECTDLMRRKAQDYQADASSVVQAMHYRRGIDTIHDVIQGKVLRAQSLIEKAAAQGVHTVEAEFESLEDTYKDLVNYASFAVSWLRGQIPGQNPANDIFNRPIVKKAENVIENVVQEVEKVVDDTFHKLGKPSTTPAVPGATPILGADGKRIF